MVVLNSSNLHSCKFLWKSIAINPLLRSLLQSSDCRFLSILQQIKVIAEELKALIFNFGNSGDFGNFGNLPPPPPPAFVPYHPKVSHPVPWLRDQAEGHNPKMTKRNGISVALQNLCFNHQPGLQGRILYVKQQRHVNCECV
jgi:hypothetical protein